MLTNLSHTQVWVLDQDVAIDFYVGKLGLVIGVDAQMEVMRWLTVSLRGTTEPEIALLPAGSSPSDDPADRASSCASASPRAGCRRSSSGRTTARRRTTSSSGGASSSRSSRQTRFYGTDCALRDPFGNSIRIGQRAEGEIEIPLAEQSRAAR